MRMRSEMIEIDHAHDIALIRVSGPVEIKDLRALTELLLEHPDHTPGMDEIWDIRDAELVGDTPSLFLSQAKYVASKQRQLAKYLGFVVANQLQYGILRMWESYSAGTTDQEYEIFENARSARVWILEKRAQEAPETDEP